MRALALVVWGCSLVACSHTPKAEMPKPTAPELERVDVFGSKHLDRDTALAKWGDDLARFVRETETQGPHFGELKEALEAKIKASGKFALVDVSAITYFSPNRSYVTVDLVDAEDTQRLKFAPAPTGTHPDPDGLLALWHEYQETAMGLLMKGEIKLDKDNREKCPFWHCITFAHESLTKYRDAFATRVAPHEAELAEILRTDRDAGHRAFAAFLLAHIADGKKVVEYMLPSIDDESELVRNNAMRVLALIANDHPEIAVPVAPIIAALQFPLTTDRNKAAAILDGIAKHDPTSHAQIKAGAGALLVEMLALKQPNNHDFAYTILKSISGQDLGEHAVDSWRAWVSGKAASPKSRS